MTARDRPPRGQTAREQLGIHLINALTECESAIVRTHLTAALKQYRLLSPTPLVTCPVCGRTGLPERIQIHDCPSDEQTN